LDGATVHAQKTLSMTHIAIRSSCPGKGVISATGSRVVESMATMDKTVDHVGKFNNVRFRLE
jgi:hypothetical protein